VFKRSHPFEGILPNMERRYRDTESNSPCARNWPSSCPRRPARLRRQPALRGRAPRAGGRIATCRRSRPCPWAKRRDYFEGPRARRPGRGEIAEKILKEIRARYRFLVDVGLNYLTLDRSADTLSGGEAQRIRLASQIGAGLVGVMYILDEPSIGLHQRDNERLLRTLTHLRDLGNTVLVVEHDEDAIRTADHIIDIGPGAGVHGGTIVAQGDARRIMAEDVPSPAPTCPGARASSPEEARPRRPEAPAAWGAGQQPAGRRSRDPAGAADLRHRRVRVGQVHADQQHAVSPRGDGAERRDHAHAGGARGIEGLEHIDKCIDIDQSPIGRTPRSNPATYTGIFTPIRELFAGTQEARSRGYKPGRFSFNVKGGRCEACQGDGVTKVEMHFLPDIYVPCDVCKGKRYNRETLDIRYKGARTSTRSSR
jgi:excinuclease ABC subunit A